MARRLTRPLFLSATIFHAVCGCASLDDSSTKYNDADKNECKNEKEFANEYEAKEKQYRDKSQPISRAEALSLARMAQFGLPKYAIQPGCEKYSTSSQNSATSVLKARATDLTDLLHDVVCKPLACDKNLSCMAAIKEQQNIALGGLKLMHSPVVNCSDASETK